MYLYSKSVILIGIYLLQTPHSVYPSGDDIKILLNNLSNKTNSVNCSDEIMCHKSNLNERNIFTNQKTIEFLKNFYNNESSEEQQNKTLKVLEAQPPVNKTTNNIDVKSTAVTYRVYADTVSNKTDILEVTTITANQDQNITYTTETTTENVLTELIPLTAYGDTELHTGQTIELQRSNTDSDEDLTNEAGVEILKNISMVCGSLLGKRISFANQTTLMEFPWTVLLLYNTKDIYHCGGSLITTKYVLTAAHCVAQEFYELTGVRLGEHDVTKEKDCEPDIAGDEICSTTIDAKVVKIIIHHGYSHLSFKNDIALLRLEQNYYSRSFYPICLPIPESTYTNTMAIVAGWGATEKALRSTVLRKAEVPILDMSKCRSIYRYSKFNDTTEICGSGVNEIDVCQGDSGGAIFYQRYVKNKQKYYQLGIISLGVRRCGDKRFLPAVFTKLKGFYKWIENNLEY